MGIEGRLIPFGNSSCSGSYDGTCLGFLEGAVDDGLIYSRALSAAEIGQIYTDGLCREDGSFPTKINISNDPDGEGDTTEFYQSESGYVRVCDVSLDEYFRL